ncbi:tRNA (N(6)-L-threonylcarbamoyladenosine(37)-C(2))-methylthiotransferase MtaB [Sphingomonas profundi]|uniref:tRNA (N(6)-L-threonylcarbamoyladenosine(37)-C(2))- methylthiotransferase MtaB n=1 Tax=Alterirhizorhabdus profundi TaxID=2681549 RepID=UPI0012E8AD07|nr:tRNA (N(6)-L-threonylcarbamoyladenosine(37)-C(2))-methylthiotransferase MtaB [Sphingomonas profundi]
MSGPQLITLGCRLNIADSEAMRAMAADQDDLVIVNTCAVTAEAVRQARKAVRRAHRERPDARILVTGCAAQIEPAAFAALAGVSRVLGTGDQKAAAFRFARPGAADIVVSDVFAVRQHAPHLATAFAEHARAFVGVQTGCDHRCTFCVIPQGRGASRSAPAGLVVDRIAALVDAGHAEVVLTGVDLTSYGADLPGAPTLAGLVERILRHVPALARLRLSSLDSIEIDERLFEVVTGEARIMPHLHLSLQSGDDMILKRMRRRHLRGEAVRMIARLKAARPEIAIGADLIAGFPTETPAMAANTLALIDDCDVVFGHVFPFSPRPFTPAARMPQVAPQVVRARAATLRAAAAARRARWLAGLAGTTQRVLVERDGRSGHAANFARVRLTAPCPPGAIAAIRISHVEDDSLIGCPA